MKASVYLTGFMAAGKTSVGRPLAVRLGMPFFDLDDEIEKVTGRDPATLIETLGEPEFRRIEWSALRGLPIPALVALGGGAFCQEAIRDYLRATGRTIFLDWPLPVLLERLAAAPSGAGPRRPLAREPEATAALYRRRLPIYRGADLCWVSRPPHHESISEVVDALEALLRPR